MNKFEYNGKCAFAMSVGKTDVEGGAKHIHTIDGRNYSFSNPIAKLLFRIIPNRIEKADEVWKQKKG